VSGLQSFFVHKGRIQNSARIAKPNLSATTKWSAAPSLSGPIAIKAPSVAKRLVYLDLHRLGCARQGGTHKPAHIFRSSAPSTVPLAAYYDLPPHRTTLTIKQIHRLRLATYAAARAEARTSISFSAASFVHCFAFRRRNLRSCSSWVRAAYHSHWRIDKRRLCEIRYNVKP
jgi:hypothetical protein